MVAERIVSLIPAATEWLCALGLGDRLVGISHECDYPTFVNDLPRVTRSRVDTRASCYEIDELVRQSSKSQTSLYDLDVEALSLLKPDLILTQTLCNVCAVGESDVRRSTHEIGNCQLLDLHGATFEQVLGDAERILGATGSQTASMKALNKIRKRIDVVRQTAIHNPRRPRVTLLEWLQPPYCSGHWTPQLIQWAGGDDPLGKIGGRSQQITMQQLMAADPEILLVACCGLDADRNQRELAALIGSDPWPSMTCVREGNVHVFDGSALFNRCGPRLIDSLETVARLVRASTERREFSRH